MGCSTSHQRRVYPTTDPSTYTCNIPPTTRVHPPWPPLSDPSTAIRSILNSFLSKRLQIPSKHDVARLRKELRCGWRTVPAHAGGKRKQTPAHILVAAQRHAHAVADGRCRAWLALLHVHELRAVWPRAYIDLLQQASGEPGSTYARQIALDVPRTFPEHDLFQRWRPGGDRCSATVAVAMLSWFGTSPTHGLVFPFACSVNPWSPSKLGTETDSGRNQLFRVLLAYSSLPTVTFCPHPLSP